MVCPQDFAELLSKVRDFIIKVLNAMKTTGVDDFLVSWVCGLLLLFGHFYAFSTLWV